MSDKQSTKILGANYYVAVATEMSFLTQMNRITIERFHPLQMWISANIKNNNNNIVISWLKAFRQHQHQRQHQQHQTKQYSDA